MPQKTKRIDVTKSFFVTDPNSVMENLRYTGREDDPEDPPPIVAYEGYNFIPTSYGYRSYFGANSQLDIDALDQTLHHCDKVFLFQLANYVNLIIALCDDGIWYTESTSVAGANWIQGVAMTAPTSPAIKEWTYCIIKNVLYLYRQGEASYQKLANTDYTVTGTGVTLTFTAVVPSFLNMAGQIGIFRANSSLAFWDSANSIAWSNPLLLSDFTPSLVTMAGNAIFNGILGRIVTVKSQGDNFVIYTTKGIVGVRYIQSTTMIWEATTITDTAGIRTSKEVTNSITEMEQYAYTNTGIKKIGSYNALSKVHQFEDIIPEIYDFLRESDTGVSPVVRSVHAVPRVEFDPILTGSSIYLDFLNGRYLFICVTNNRIIDGLVSATLNVVRSLNLNILVNGLNWPGLIVPSDVYIVDPVDGTVPMPAYIDNKRENDPPYDDDMYLVWRPTGKGTFANQVTPMNDYVVNNVGAHVPNSNNKVDATIGAIAVNAKDLVLNNYYHAVTPTYPDHMDDLGYRGYGSIAAGTAWLGVMDTTLLAYANAQELEWANLSLIQNANKAIFDAVSPSPVEEGAITGLRFRTDDTGIFPEITAAMNAYVATKIEGTVYDNVNAYGSSLECTEEILDMPTAASSVNSGNTFSGVGTNYAIYTLTKTLKKALRIKRSTTIGTIRPIIKIQHFVASMKPTDDIFGVSTGPDIDFTGNRSYLGNSPNDAYQIFARLLNEAYIHALEVPEYYSGLSKYTYSHTTVGVYAPNPTRFEAIYIWRIEEPPAGPPSAPYISNSTLRVIDPNYKIPGEPLMSTGDHTEVIISEAGIPYVNIEYTTYEFWYTIGGESITSMWNGDLADIDIPLTMTAYQSNVTWYEATTDPGEPAYVTNDPQAGYNLVLQGPNYNQISAPSVLTPVDFGYTYPGATFLMQDGIPAPYYPTYVGALVLDTALKKWGKMKAEFQTLLDYSPFNSASGDVVPYSNLGVDMGILVNDGFIYNMDAKPLESFMRYGKIGYFRQGYTYLEEVRVHFRLPSTGTIKLAGTLNGLTLDKDIEQLYTYTDVLNMNCFGHIAARWHTIEISGNYDIQYIEYRGTLSSRR
jgi:hypothetical protein